MTFKPSILSSGEYASGRLTVSVPIPWLLRNTVVSSDFSYITCSRDWERMIVQKARDSGFPLLVESMQRRGWLESHPMGWYDGHIGEGHHRFVAAILLGMDNAWVNANAGWQERFIFAHDDGTKSGIIL